MFLHANSGSAQLIRQVQRLSRQLNAADVVPHLKVYRCC
ncbi:hypothetical protein EV129_107151 [Rhizobium azibense]|uniref:Uncharacterized protein n=1 Tax=Rhizobium azibense TaxID=1136135 RepID=A0A4R3RXK4_9HYPH|nr:hypothetical protein EV129_107151 [Rhizobium azibense]